MMAIPNIKSMLEVGKLEENMFGKNKYACLQNKYVQFGIRSLFDHFYFEHLWLLRQNSDECVGNFGLTNVGGPGATQAG